MALTSLIFAIGQETSYAGFSGGNSQTVGLSSAITTGAGGSPTGGGEITISGGALLPDAGLAGTSADLVDIPQSDQISLYVVRDGDSLSSIAQMFKVSVNTIVWANDLARGAVLKEGQLLTILPVSGVQHVVAKGETVASIAQKFGGDEKEIRQFNDLGPEAVLAVGQVVLVPGGEEPAPPASRPSVTSPVHGAGGPNYAGYYLRPIEGGVRTQGLHGYNAVDLANRSGTPIMAAAAGRVIISKTGGWNGGYGNYVVIEHPNRTQTLYAHMLNSIVGVGQTVVQGQVIGYLGQTGKATGPHLHFEVRGAKNPF